MRSAVALFGIALAGACGDDGDGDTGNDTQTQSASASESESASVTASSSESASAEAGSESESASASASTDTGTAESGDSTEDSASATITATSSSDGGSSDAGESGSSSDTGMVCSGEQESCAAGETCCAQLECCAGVPVPRGQEYCSAGGCPVSDRDKKENFASVDPGEVLDKVVALPITTWNYTFEDASVRHIGPMAQDFKAAFGVGASDKGIFQVDADGVVLASVQALHGEIETLQRENEELRERLARLERAVAR